jgi:type I restriction enzyme S subunit
VSFPAYPAYQDSGVEWLGPLPRGWAVKRVKHVTRSIEQGWSPQCDGFPVASTEEWGVLKVGCVNGGRFDPEENKALPAELTPIPELGISAGDVLISRANTRELVGGAVCVSADHPNLLLCDKLYRLRLNDAVCLPQWLAVYLRSDAARGQIELAASGASQSMVNIGQGTILDLPMPLPTRDEQSQILVFLDRETGKIDALVAEQERLIALLKEKRQAVISQAVTKGLDASAPMKDSGVAWLGQVPAHWEVAPLKHLADFINGEAFKPTEWSDDGTPIIRIQNLNGGDDFNCYNGEVNPRHHVQKGDLLFGWSGNRGTSFGPFVWPREGLHYLNQHIFKVEPRSCNVGWFYWCLRAVTIYVEEQAHGIIGMVHVTKGVLGAIPVPLPPPAEQAAIAAFLDRKTGDIDTLTSEAHRAIALLRERRAALISAAVTGKIDVRGAIAAPAAEAA